MKNLKSLSVLFLVIILNANTYAQEETAGLVTFIYPVAGINAVNCSNKLSVNIVGEVNGGVNDFELVSVLNIKKSNVHGIQNRNYQMNCSFW